MAAVSPRSYITIEGNYLPHACLVGIDAQNCLDSLNTFGDALGTVSCDHDNEVDLLFKLWDPVRFRRFRGIPRESWESAV